MTPPLVVDIDGTMTRPHEGPRERAVDPRAMTALREWPAAVVLATGKAFPFPIALCGFVGIDERVIAENGGIVYADDEVRTTGDPEAAWAVADAYRADGYDLGWGDEDTANRWRETEVVVNRDSPEEPLRRIAAEHGMEVVDTGYAYHVKSPGMNKGAGLREICAILDRDPSAFVAVGDSVNDATTFEAAGRSFAVANADETARAAADEVLSGEHTDGLLEALDRVREGDAR
jgi:phosphoglycolate phosphatase (TIGR01487 family)